MAYKVPPSEVFEFQKSAKDKDLLSPPGSPSKGDRYLLQTFTKVLLHCDGIDGSQTFIDETGKTVTTYGHAQIDTAQYKFGSASVLFDGNGDDYLSLDQSEEFNFGSDKFTIDFWVRFSAVDQNQSFFGLKVDGTNFWWLGWTATGTRLYFACMSGGIYLTRFYITFSPAINTWYHIALVRDGNTVNFWHNFIDGVEQSKTIIDGSYNFTIPNFSSPLYVGTHDPAGSYWMKGWMDEIRISKGIARWNSNFTPPSFAYEHFAGAWAQKDNQITFYNGVEWDFVTPVEGFIVWVQDEDVYYKYNGSDWSVLLASDLMQFSQSRFKIGSFTRDTSLASGTQEVTGLGFRPKAIIFFSCIAGTRPMSIGFDNATDFHTIIYYDAVTDECWTIGNWGSIALYLGPTSGTSYNGKITTLGNDGFTITWTKDGSPTGTATIKYIAFN